MDRAQLRWNLGSFECCKFLAESTMHMVVNNSCREQSKQPTYYVLLFCSGEGEGLGKLVLKSEMMVGR